MKSFTGEHKNVFIKIRDGEITEKYSILQEIGEGGLGKVYKVIHVTTGLIRVIK